MTMGPLREVAENEPSNVDIIESVVLNGDLGRLSAEQLVRYYLAECARMGLDPLSRPFDLLKFQGKLVLYSNRRCADQLAAKHGVTRSIVEGPEVRDFDGEKLLYCKVRVSTPGGRVEEDVATLPAKDLVNAVMKIATKAARRATLKVCGWGGTDESELDTMPGARTYSIREYIDEQKRAGQLGAPQSGPNFVASDGHRAELARVAEAPVPPRAQGAASHEHAAVDDLLRSIADAKGPKALFELASKILATGLNGSAAAVHGAYAARWVKCIDSRTDETSFREAVGRFDSIDETYREEHLGDVEAAIKAGETRLGVDLSAPAQERQPGDEG